MREQVTLEVRGGRWVSRRGEINCKSLKKRKQEEKEKNNLKINKNYLFKFLTIKNDFQDEGLN